MFLIGEQDIQAPKRIELDQQVHGFVRSSYCSQLLRSPLVDDDHRLIIFFLRKIIVHESMVEFIDKFLGTPPSEYSATSLAPTPAGIVVSRCGLYGPTTA